MDTYSSDDYEIPIEGLPGILGYSWDGAFFPLDESLQKLQVINLLEYSELIEEYGGYRLVSVEFRRGCKEIQIEAYGDIALILDQVPSIAVLRDSVPPDAGPASGSGFLFFLNDGCTLEDVAFDVFMLRGALIRDISCLKESMS